MRRRGAGVMAAAVVWGGLAAAAGQVRAEELPAAPVKTGGWWGVWFKDKAADKPGERPASPAGAPAASGTTVAVQLPTDATPVVPASVVLEQAEEAYQRERQAWVRRVEVCDRLRDIAIEKGDSELENQANALADMAWRVCEQRTARLPRPVSSGKGRADKNTESELVPGDRSPLHRGSLRPQEGRRPAGGTVTGEEKP